MSTLFCPNCGKAADIFYDAVCGDCFIGKRKLIECHQVLYLRICPSCGSVFKKGKWISRADEIETILDHVRDSLLIDKQAVDLKLTLSPERLDYSRYRVHVEACADIKEVPIAGTLDTEIRISWETCGTCSRISGGYFEGIVQIRADKRIPTKDELENCKGVSNEVAMRAQEKGDRLAFIPRIEELGEGIDIYVGSQKLGKQICKAIIDTFGGKYSESPKLVGQKNGVDLYRITFALRLPEFVRGDIIYADGAILEVQSSGKHISGIDIETGKRFIENFNSVLDVRKLGSINDAVPAVLIADEGRTVQILDPVTYESITIKRPEFLSVEPGNEVKIIRTSRGLFVLP